MLQKLVDLGIACLLLRRQAQQPVSQHEPRRMDVIERQTEHHVPAASVDPACSELRLDPGFSIGIAFDHPAKALLPADRLTELDPHLVTRPALEVLRAHQRPVDPWRGDLQPVGARHRIIGIQHRRKCSRDPRALVSRKPPVGPFRHDLESLTVASRKLDPDQTKTQFQQQGLRELRDFRRYARLDQKSSACVGVFVARHPDPRLLTADPSGASSK